MTTVRILIFYTCFFLLKTSAVAQNFYFKHYRVDDGLTNNTVLCTTQDSKGFMWFGTKDGLNRFDGYSFKVFRKQDLDSTSLPSNSISSVYNSKHGTLWIGTEKGLCTYNPLTETFSTIKGTEGKNILEIVEQGKLIWFIADLQLYRYSPETVHLENFSDLYKFGGFSTLAIDKQNNLWVGAFYGVIAMYDSRAYTFHRYTVDNLNKPITSQEVTNIIDDGKGLLLIGTASSGVKIFNLQTKKFSEFLDGKGKKAEQFIRKILITSPVETWVATEDGVFIYHAKKNVAHIVKNISDPYSLSDNAVYDLYKDNEGGVWATTYFGGVNYMQNASIAIKKYFPLPNQNSISGSAVREIVQDESGKLWIGTENGGLNKFDPVTGKFKSFLPGDGSKIAYTNIHGLCVDGHKLWIGTFENGLDVMNLKTEKVIQHYVAGNFNETLGLKSNFIHSIHKTKEGRLLFSTSTGFYEFDKKIQNFRLFNQLPFNTFYSSITDEDTGTIWVGTFTEGVVFTNLDNGISGKLKIIRNGINKLEQTRVVYVKTDRQKNIWICTEDGLYKVAKDLKTVTEYNADNGLPGNMVYAVVQDNQNNIWITTSKGLVRLDYKTQQLVSFSQSDGLLSDQFNYSSAFIDSSNNIYLGSVKGLISFNADNYTVRNFPVRVFITEFEPANGDNKKPANFWMQQIKQYSAVTLKYNEASFKIGFSALHFSSPENVAYAYKLTGVDKNWNYIKDNRQVNFSNLPVGSYKFIVRSTNGEGIWLANEKTITITVLPPWWLSNFAKSIYLLLSITAIALMLKWYSNRQVALQKKKMQLFEANKQKELYETKLDFFTKVAHEIKTPLTLIKGPMDKIMKSADVTAQTEKHLNTMNRNTDRLFELTKQLLDFRKIESEQIAIRFTNIDLVKLIENILTDFRASLENSEHTISFLHSQKHCMIMADEDSLKKIITNLIENGIKYGEQKLMVSITENEGTITTKFCNDGLLVPLRLKNELFKPFFRVYENDQAGGTGIGLSLAKSLTELHAGTLEFSIEEGLNTFTLTLPIKP